MGDKLESSKIRDKDAITILIPSGVRHSFLHLLQELVAGGPQLRAILGIALRWGGVEAEGSRGWGYGGWRLKRVGMYPLPKPLHQVGTILKGHPVL